jgi:hypothetical protein
MSVRCIKSKPDTDTTGEYQAVVSGTLLRNVWLDRNLGATQKATSGTDSNAYGTYYKLGKATWSILKYLACCTPPVETEAFRVHKAAKETVFRIVPPVARLRKPAAGILRKLEKEKSICLDRRRG